MICKGCGWQGDGDARFCTQCGDPMTRTCGSCHSELSPDAKFCGQCGVAVEQTAEPTHQTQPELRQITTLFCDLVGSTALASSIDAEDWREVLNQYQETCVEIINDLDGYMAQYLGDGLLCYFGYPTASEHDAENAARAGLEMAEQVSKLEINVNGRKIKLQVRIGIHTGPVVVGEIGAGSRRETLALGATTNLAARLQAAAEPDTVLISEYTQRLVRDRLTLEALGAQQFAGFDGAVRVFKVTGISRTASSDVGAAISPFTGRAADLAILIDRARKAQTGRGQCVLVTGEPGIGKTRLIRGLRESLDQTQIGWLECRAEHYTHQQPLRPVVELITMNLGIDGDITTDKARKLLEEGLNIAGLEQASDHALIAQLLGLATEQQIALVAEEPSEARARLLDALARWVVGLSGERPLVLVVEDLQWLDTSSISWLEGLVHLTHDQRLLVVVTQRPQALPRWNHLPHTLALSIAPLEHDEALQLVRSLCDSNPLTLAAAEQIVERADGNPLFIEELVSTIDQALNNLEIPMTLQDSLMSRLDAVGEAKEIAQIGSCIGREFRLDVLAAVTGLPSDKLRAQVKTLLEAGLLFPRRAKDETYLFKHALTRDTAYQSLVRTARRSLHDTIAGTLERQFQEIASEQPELIAHHYTLAEGHNKAVDYLVRAGDKEREQFAYREAVTQYNSALEAVSHLPEDEAQQGRELAIRMSLGRLLTATAGYGANEVRANAQRVGELCDALGDGPAVFPALFEQWSVALGREDPDGMLDFATRLLALAQRMGDPGLMTETELAMAATYMNTGDPAESVKHAERSIDRYDFERDRQHVHMFGQDPCMMAHAVGALGLVVTGRLDDAAAWAQESLAAAQRTEHPYSIVCAYGFQTPVRSLRGEWKLGLEAAQSQLELARTHGFALYQAGAYGHMAVALVGLGRYEEAVEAAQQSTDGYNASNSRSGSLTPLIALANAHLHLNDLDACSHTLAKAHRLMADHVTPYKWPELLTVSAEHCLAANPDARNRANAYYQQALAIAHQQGTHLTALTTATSYATLSAALKGSAQAAESLENYIARVSQGHDTPVYQNALAALDSLK